MLSNAGNNWGLAERDIIVQSVNSGGDVHCPQFDLQVGVGGQGIHNKQRIGNKKRNLRTRIARPHEGQRARRGGE